MTALRATVSNRGDIDVPYGYVYVNDTRLSYTTCSEHVHVGGANWGMPTKEEGRAMMAALHAAFPDRDLTVEDLRECQVFALQLAASRS